jgi:thiamine biosynthesis protein ThiS
MIKLNGKECLFEGGTVKQLLEMKRFVYPRIIVSINNILILPEEYDNTHIRDGDDVRVIHLLAGG